MESRTKNGVRNIYSAFVNQAISIVLPFIVRTVFIRSLGEQYLGLNSLFVYFKCIKFIRIRIWKCISF